MLNNKHKSKSKKIILTILAFAIVVFVLVKKFKKKVPTTKIIN